MTVQKLYEMTRDDPQTKPPFWIFYAISTYVAWYKRRRSVEMRFPSAQLKNVDNHYCKLKRTTTHTHTSCVFGSLVIVTYSRGGVTVTYSSWVAPLGVNLEDWFSTLHR
jgi:hypothetical protein